VSAVASRLLAAMATCLACLAAGTAPAASVPAATAAPAATTGTPAGRAALAYPVTRKDDVVDDYFGVKVADPYRWLEDLEAPETAAWVAAENRVTYAYLDKLPERDSIRRRLTALWDYRRTDIPTLEAGSLWFAQNTGLQRQSPVYRQRGFDAKPDLVIDPNALSPDGSVAMGQWSPSPDGRYLGYTSAAGGSDVADIHVRDIGSGRDLPVIVPRVKFTGIAWTHDSKGFFYARFKGTEKSADFADAGHYHQVWYHDVAGDRPDRLIFDRPDDPTASVGASLSDDGRWLYLYSGSGTTNNRLWIADLGSPDSPDLDARPVPMATEEDAIYSPLGVVDGVVYLYTTYRAPKGRIVAARPGDADRDGWREVVPESDSAIGDAGAVLVGDRLAVAYMVDVQTRVRLYSLDGKPTGEIPLPEAGSVLHLSGRNGGHELYIEFTSFLRPSTIYRWELAGPRLEPFYPPHSPFDADRYETRALFYTSKDGTRIPMFVTMRKGTVLDGRHPAMLYGYGGFNLAQVPKFAPEIAGWLELGGIFALANLRGGSEYGEAWHRAGTRERKQNVFDDFIAAGEYLVREKYTTSSRLVIRGRSNGGLLIGAAMTQRPDLFAVALPMVGVLDMMRFQKFTAGPFWVDDYGSSDDPQGAKYLLAYSPLQNLKPGTCYPATLITTADRDDRVVPSHSFKFAATLQADQGCAKPTLIRIEVAGSHAYRPTDRVIAEFADMWAFALHNVEPGD
jgi:prolyl oligopeptidase